MYLIINKKEHKFIKIYKNQQNDKLSIKKLGKIEKF